MTDLEKQALDKAAKELQLANKCPKCGADEVLPRLPCGCIWWTCESRMNKGKPFEESRDCLPRQLAASESRYRDLAEAMGATVHQPHEAIVKLALQGQHADTALAVAVERAEKAEAAMLHTWTCGCGWRNGVNLAVCAQCNRTPDQYSRQDEPGQALLDELNRLRAVVEIKHEALDGAYHLMNALTGMCFSQADKKNMAALYGGGLSQQIKAALDAKDKP